MGPAVRKKLLMTSTGVNEIMHLLEKSGDHYRKVASLLLLLYMRG